MYTHSTIPDVSLECLYDLLTWSGLFFNGNKPPTSKAEMTHTFDMRMFEEVCRAIYETEIVRFHAWRGISVSTTGQTEVVAAAAAILPTPAPEPTTVTVQPTHTFITL
jgi:hypothetical protein